MRILLADDQNEIRALTADQLERDGHSVVAVADGKQALHEFARASFDVLLLDEHMPVMSGVDVLHAVRRMERGAHQIVVAVTGYNTDPDRLRLLREGFDFVIGKPFRLDQLQATLHAVLDSRASPAHVTPPAAKSPTSSPDLLRAVGGDQKLLLRMIRTFLRDTPKRLAKIESAIRLEQAENLASLAHALKGSVGIFDVSLAHQHCHELQELGRSKELAEAGRIFARLKEEIAKVERNLRGYAGQRGVSAPGAKRKRKYRGSAAKRKPR